MVFRYKPYHHIYDSSMKYTDYETNSKIYEESTPKNRTSRRTVVINNFTYQWLLEQKHRAEQAGIENEYVIPANSGRMVKKSSLTGTFKVFCNYVGVEYESSHTCRRSYVTNCLDKGMRLALVSKNAGHMNKRLRLIEISDFTNSKVIIW